MLETGRRFGGTGGKEYGPGAALAQADLGSAMIHGVVLPVGFVAEQIAAAQHVDGVERVKIRDRSGKEGWVTPDARPKGGQVFFTKVDTGADGVRRFMQFKRREDGPDSRSYLFSSPDSRSEVRFYY